MESKELMRFCLKEGILLDKEVLTLFSEVISEEVAKVLIEKIKTNTQNKIINKSFFIENKEKFENLILTLPGETQKEVEKLKINLGLSIEISKEISREIKIIPQEILEDVKVVFSYVPQGKKLEVGDFVNYFRNRFFELKNILQDHPELNNLISINKISGYKQGISLIGLVYSKRVTKNGNIIFEIEDLTGNAKVLIIKDKKEIYEKAENVTLDSVLGFKVSGKREMMFVNDIVFPDASLPEKKRSPVEEYCVFVGDFHMGSKLFMEENFLKFVDYINGNFPNTPEVEKIKYLFIVGDLIAGVGAYPGQEKELIFSDLESQFQFAAELLSKIRKDIKIIICTGNHDGVRLMEPQPIFLEKYAWPIYNLKNVLVVTNPSMINIGAKLNFSGFNVLCYHGFSFFYYADNIPMLIKQKAAHCPELIMTYLLKNRHLAPTHASTQYFPSEKDLHLIKNVPDIFFAGHTHKSGLCYYNNILVISSSSWESPTAYQEKRGSKPDFCKVPIMNLKTGAIKILDFE